jgi:hypothetical protein
MPRDRAALTDKEEKILVQAQLMGLSTSSMVKIGNRLKAIEKDREDKNRIDQDCHGYTWTKISNGWSLITPEGYTCEFTDQKQGKSSWYDRTFSYKIKVHKPGTRYKPKFFKEKSLRVSDDWRAKLCPANSKQVYAMVRFCHNLKYEISHEATEQV